MRTPLTLLVLASTLAACASEPRATADRRASAERPDAEARETAGESLLEQYAATYRFRMGAPQSFAFTPDGATVLYLRSGPRDRVRDLYALDVETGQERVLATADGLLGGDEAELTAEERARRERQRDIGRGVSSFDLAPDGETVLVPLSGRVFLLDIATREARELESDAGAPIDPRLSPDGALLASVRDGDLYVQDVETGEQTRLTEKESDDIAYGVSEFVAQEEMGRDHGYWFSPDSERIACQRTDTSMVETLRIMDPADPTEPPQTWPYPRAGTDNAEVALGIMPATGGETTWVEWDRSRWPYLATVKWPEDGPLTLVVQNREQTESAVLAVEASSGSTRTLHVERDEAWINLDQSVPHWLPEDAGFLWSTERNGDWQIEHRSPEGELITTLTTPADGYERLLRVDDETGKFYFLGRPDQTRTQVYVAPLDVAAGRPRPLTGGRASHGADFAEDADLWVHSVSDLAGERSWTVRALGGEPVATVPSVCESPARPINVELTTVTGARTYPAAIVRPTWFEEGMTLPTLVHVYGGPTSVMVRSSLNSYVIDQWLADRGFIVVRADGRGTPGKDRAWQRVIKGDFITVPLEDQADAFRALAERYPEIDETRVGIFGWSFGGYFSAMAACREPDVFHAASVGAPVIDWRDYDTHYTERYLGVPGEAGVDHDLSNVLTYAPDLERPMLLIHGTADDNVYFVHSARLADALLREGVPFRFLPLPGHTHGVTDPEVVESLHERIAVFFEESLDAE